MADALQIEDLEVGTGATAEPGKHVTVHYTGWLADGGKKFDSSHDRGKPFTFLLGGGDVIKGWDQRIMGTLVGGKHKLIVSAHLAYGQRKMAKIIATNSDLTFEIELFDVKTRDE